MEQLTRCADCVRQGGGPADGAPGPAGALRRAGGQQRAPGARPSCCCRFCEDRRAPHTQHWALSWLGCTSSRVCNCCTGSCSALQQHATVCMTPGEEAVLRMETLVAVLAVRVVQAAPRLGTQLGVLHGAGVPPHARAAHAAAGARVRAGGGPHPAPEGAPCPHEKTLNLKPKA